MENLKPYEALCESLTLNPAASLAPIDTFQGQQSLAEKSKEEIFAAALQVLVEQIELHQDHGVQVNHDLIDKYIVKIDVLINRQLNGILHHPEFQALESSWRQVEYLIKHMPAHQNIKLDLLDITKAELQEDFQQQTDVTHSALFEHVYRQEYDTPGGEPYAAIISEFEFTHEEPDIDLLKSIAKVGAAAQCPFIACASERFFQKKHIADVMMMADLKGYLNKAEYIAWQQFRNSDESRYIGLTLPKFLLRLPYGVKNPIKNGFYEELCCQHEDFLWGKASFAFAANLLKSFASSGWAVQIRGEHSGGKVMDLPLYQRQISRGLQNTIPTESIVPESRELELAECGFIPLSYYKNSNFACFYSANSVQCSKSYDQDNVTANAHLNTRLPYVFLASRIAHYLKVLQRENIGAAKNATVLQSELNSWLKTLVTAMHNPEPEVIATHPLKNAYVQVKDVPNNPGFYKVALFISPHYQLEGVDVTLSLVAEMPAADARG